MSELAGVAAALFVGGRLTIEDEHGAVLSAHPVTASDGAVLAVADARATSPGIASRFRLTSASGLTTVIGTPDLDRYDIEEGADVLIASLTLQGA